MSFVTRFAPSPTGPLHLGHAFAAQVAHGFAQADGGRFLLRIEDLDQTRARPVFTEAIFDDLRWLGLNWDGAVIQQSLQLPHYAAALARLIDLGVVYPCSCRRQDILAAVGAPQEGSIDGPVYPGTCRHREIGTRQSGDALRLNLGRALDLCPSLSFAETGPFEAGSHVVSPEDLVRSTGDIILQRRDSGEFAYHLAVVVDDAAQGVTLVTRGADLFAYTPVQVVLQHLLGLPRPVYHHHRLIRDAAGKRLAKRDDARAIAAYRAAGLSPAEVFALL